MQRFCLAPYPVYVVRYCETRDEKTRVVDVHRVLVLRWAYALDHTVGAVEASPEIQC